MILILESRSHLDQFEERLAPSCEPRVNEIALGSRALGLSEFMRILMSNKTPEPTADPRCGLSRSVGLFTRQFGGGSAFFVRPRSTRYTLLSSANQKQIYEDIIQRTMGCRRQNYHDVGIRHSWLLYSDLLPTFITPLRVRLPDWFCPAFVLARTGCGIHGDWL